MAKYPVTHACGCEVEHRLYGPHADRDRRMAWLAKQPCDECARSQSAIDDRMSGLPALVGTDKQIAWAESIRRTLLPRWAAHIDRWARRWVVAAAERPAIAALPDAEREQWIAATSALNAAQINLLAEWRQEQSAKWWIDHRDDDGSMLVREAVTKVPALVALISRLKLIDSDRDALRQATIEQFGAEVRQLWPDAVQVARKGVD